MVHAWRLAAAVRAVVVADGDAGSSGRSPAAVAFTVGIPLF
jgi:hypothetical protein